MRIQVKRASELAVGDRLSIHNATVVVRSIEVHRSLIEVSDGSHSYWWSPDTQITTYPQQETVRA